MAGLACPSPLATRHGGEDVVGVHGTEDEAGAVPGSEATATEKADLHAVEASEADGVEVKKTAIVDDGGRVVVHVAEGREEEGPVDEGELVEDRKRRAADDAGRFLDGTPRQRSHQEVADLVVSVRSVVFRLDVVRILD